MNYVEQDEYNRLTEDQKEEYDFQKRKHPTWSHEKLMTRVGFSEKVDQVVDSNENVDPNDKSIMEEIVQGVGDWLERTLPRIWQGVKDFFRGLLQGIWDGIVSTFEGIFSWFD